MSIVITTEQKVHLKIDPKTSAGNPATLDGKPSWTIESGNATLQVDDDGLGAWLISSDTVSQGNLKVSADADLGAGVRTIELLEDYNITNAEADSLGLTQEPPVLK